MTVETTTEKQVRCPACGETAKRVSALTLRALLKDEYASAFSGAEYSCCEGHGETGCNAATDETGYRFCDSQACDVVYFAEADSAIFKKEQLKVVVGVKETTGDRPLCYCFGHSVASIKEELRTKGRCDALQDIRERMNTPGCRYETENPSGSCCLGSVSKGIKIAQEEL